MSKIGTIQKPAFTEKVGSEVAALESLRKHSGSYRSHYIRHSREDFTVVHFDKEVGK